MNNKQNKGDKTMRFYVIELPQKQYHEQTSDHPVAPKNCSIRPKDEWHSIWSDYYIDKVEYDYAANDIRIYATKTKLTKARRNLYYKKHK